jgi:Uri superfamily endonuclease
MERPIPDEIAELKRSDKGSYVIEFRLREELAIGVGKLGRFQLEPGWYYYVGSAMGGLRARITRHINGTGKVRWHVDYLAQALEPSRVWFIVSERRLEEKLAGYLSTRLGCGIPRFGCGDSRSSKTHLFYSKKRIQELGIIDGHAPRCAIMRSLMVRCQPWRTKPDSPRRG